MFFPLAKLDRMLIIQNILLQYIVVSLLLLQDSYSSLNFNIIKEHLDCYHFSGIVTLSPTCTLFQVVQGTKTLFEWNVVAEIYFVVLTKLGE